MKELDVAFAKVQILSYELSGLSHEVGLKGDYSQASLIHELSISLNKFVEDFCDEYQVKST